MKKLLLLFLLCLLQLPAAAQDSLQVVHVHENISTHFISPEPIRYVDISTDQVAGDVPVDNILRLRPKGPATGPGVVTIVGERFLVQYRLLYSTPDRARPEVRIDPLRVASYVNPSVGLSREEMARFALQVLGKKPRARGPSVKRQGIRARVHQVYTVGEYFFVDFSLQNKTGIPYTIDQLRFKIEDKKVVRASNFQQVELRPLYQLYETGSFKRRYRNVFVFRKFTFPEEKVFHIEVAEEQISGRTISLRVNYAFLLGADTL